MAEILVSRLHLVIRVQSSKTAFLSEYQNCKTFMDKAALIGYDDASMPFIFLKNRIDALTLSLPRSSIDNLVFLVFTSNFF